MDGDVDVEQAGFDLRCEWGLRGVEALAPGADAIVIVDVLSFSTCVDVAVARGARVFPWAWGASGAQELARERGAELAGKRGGSARFSLSPLSLGSIEPDSAVVLPSPNGSSLSLATGDTPTLCGCLRNARSLARAAARYGRCIGVVPAGERWPDGSLRSCVEDWLGAGAILAALDGERSPEAQMAVDAFQSAESALESRIAASVSGRELGDRGFSEDVSIACQLDASDAVPELRDGCYTPR